MSFHADVDGGVADGVLVSGVAKSEVSVRATSSATDTTNAIAATMVVTPTTQGQRGCAWSPSTSSGAG
ncbi:hypothetical protein C1Y40_01672 [Mycobacterium talmoniae]|uniref:Uncharacterized protein n=1 Tax=Mycobacterium talmoniae TaxID=1858794 RepID=A0A2S8BNH0_9MYCO|nr:hypothetical protein C1Y40_01672 [Mycobacterium talmoniae]